MPIDEVMRRNFEEDALETGPVTADEAYEALVRFNASHFFETSAAAARAGQERARYSIPPNAQRDDDVRLGAYITQTEAELARLRPIETAARKLVCLLYHCGFNETQCGDAQFDLEALVFPSHDVPEPCEGCRAPATGRSLDEVPLCDACGRAGESSEKEVSDGGAPEKGPAETDAVEPHPNLSAPRARASAPPAARGEAGAPVEVVGHPGETGVVRGVRDAEAEYRLKEKMPLVASAWSSYTVNPSVDNLIELQRFLAHAAMWAYRISPLAKLTRDNPVMR